MGNDITRYAPIFASRPCYRFLMIDNQMPSTIFKLEGDYSENKGIKVVGNKLGDLVFIVDAEPM